MIQFVTIHRISQLQVTKCYNSAKQPTRYWSNITRTAMNKLLGIQTRGFHRFPTRRNDFFLTFLVFVLVDPWTETMNMHVQEESKLVPGVVACWKVYSTSRLMHLPKKWVQNRGIRIQSQVRGFSDIFWFFFRFTWEKLKWLALTLETQDRLQNQPHNPT